jgi:hypothetical protein
VNNTSVPMLTARDQGVQLKWVGAPEAKSYIFSLVKDGSAEKTPQQDQQTKVPELLIRDLKSGHYRWFVRALDEFGDESPVSERWDFTVEDVPPLAWADGMLNARTMYRTKTPYAKLTWARGPSTAVKWRIRMMQTREPASGDQWQVVTLPQYEARPAEAGTYYFEAEALDSDDAVVGRTQVRMQEFSQQAPPESPRFTDQTPQVIEARDDGALDLEWYAVRDAREYVVVIKTSAGAEVQSLKVKSPRASFERLKTGEYSVSLSSIDAFGRQGPQSEARVLRVPEWSDVAAPVLKGVNVK